MRALARMRKREGLTQKELAELLEVDRSTIVKWETDASNPTYKTIPQIADLFGCSINDLFKDDEEGEEGTA